MIRRLTFGFVLVTAFIVAACGRQVTPNPPGVGAGGAPLGYMAAYFDVSSPFNFSNYQYMFVFNTTGNGVTPSTQTLQTNWAGYSYALMALGSGGAAYAKPVQFIRNSNPHISPAWIFLGSTPQQFSFNANSNGSGTEFSMLFQQRIFASPSPVPSGTPRPYAPMWTFNAFVTQASNQGQWLFYDSMGAGGPVPPEFVNTPQLCITEPFDQTYYAIYSGGQDPSAQIVSVELANNPAHPTPCP
ncbi:MAG TPA: hypothetical protein VF778_10355 [Xanthobacteraceae bacterium]